MEEKRKDRREGKTRENIWRMWTDIAYNQQRNFVHSKEDRKNSNIRRNYLNITLTFFGQVPGNG